MRLTARDLTAEAFAPYGDVIERPASAAEASGPGWMWWSETATMAATDRPYAVGYLDLMPAPLQFDWAEAHARSPELIAPLNGAVAIYVGVAGDAPNWERLDVFRVRPGQAVVLRPGTWHGAPLAIGRPMRALVLLRQGTGSEDVTKATRPEGPIQVDLEHDAHQGG